MVYDMMGVIMGLIIPWDDYGFNHPSLHCMVRGMIMGLIIPWEDYGFNHHGLWKFPVPLLYSKIGLAI